MSLVHGTVLSRFGVHSWNCLERTLRRPLKMALILILPYTVAVLLNAYSTPTLQIAGFTNETAACLTLGMQLLLFLPRLLFLYRSIRPTPSGGHCIIRRNSFLDSDASFPTCRQLCACRRLRLLLCQHRLLFVNVCQPSDSECRNPTGLLGARPRGVPIQIPFSRQKLHHGSAWRVQLCRFLRLLPADQSSSPCSSCSHSTVTAHRSALRILGDT